jgi:hypothetical protein
MSQDNGDKVLLKSRFGSVDGGTCTLEAPHAGTIWDRLRCGGLASVTAEISVTSSRIRVKRMVGAPYEIPIEQIVGLYPANSVGGRYWGRNSVLRVVWRSGEEYRCSWLMLGPGRDVALAWQEELGRLIDPERAGAAPDSEENAAAMERVQRQNGRLKAFALTAVVLSVIALPVLLVLLR